jgi:hypothetical protein
VVSGGAAAAGYSLQITGNRKALNVKRRHSIATPFRNANPARLHDDKTSCEVDVLAYDGEVAILVREKAHGEIGLC